MQNKKQQKINMKKGAIDQAIAWLLLFVSFIVVFYFIIDYSRVSTFRDEITTISNLGARIIAVGGTEDDVVARVNEVKSGLIADATAGNLTCNNLGTNNFRIVFTTEVSIDSDIVPDNLLSNRVGVFNEVNSDDIDCTLQLNEN